MHRPGLYYPYVNVRDDDWLKVAALYWPTVRRLVPAGYATHDSPVAAALAEAGILGGEDPARLLGDLPAMDLLKTMREHARSLAPFTIAAARSGPVNGAWLPQQVDADADPRLGWIHPAKLDFHLLDWLEDRHLAVRGRFAPASDRFHDGPEYWVGMHPVLAGAYMSVLATRLSEVLGFDALTDQADPTTSTPNSDAASVFRLLTGSSRGLSTSDGRSDPDSAAHQSKFIMMAMQTVCPRGVSDVDVTKIIKCRVELAEELDRFRDYIAQQNDELAQIAALPVAQRRTEQYAEHARLKIEAPLEALERGLRLSGIDSVRGLLTTTGFAPGAVIGAALSKADAAPEVYGSTGLAVAIGTAWWQARTINAQIRRTSPVAYLLDARHQLESSTLTQRVKALLKPRTLRTTAAGGLGSARQ